MSGMAGITELDTRAVGIMKTVVAVVMAAATTMMTTVAVTITITAAAAAATMTGIGTMTGIEAVIHRLPGLEVTIPTGIPVDVKSSKVGAGTYVSALLRVGIKQGFILCLHAMFIVCLQIFYRFLWKLF